MPDFHVLREQLHTDLSRVDWSPAADVRAAGDRRRRNQTLAVTTVAAVVVAAIASMALLLPDGRITSTPFGHSVAQPSSQLSFRSVLNTPGDPSAPPADYTPPPPGPTAPAEAVPTRALLTASDVSPDFTGVDQPFVGAYSGNPFLTCDPDALAAYQPPAASAVGFLHTQTQPLLGGESVMQYGGNDGWAMMAQLRAVIAGPCAGVYHITQRHLEGDDSLLLSTTDPNTVLALAAHGNAVYYAIVVRGSYLIWVTIIDQDRTANALDLTATLVVRAEDRLCATMLC
jgi:hypothetical protein